MTGTGKGAGHDGRHGHHGTCNWGKEKVIKVALVTVILLMAIQYGFNVVFYSKYQPLFFTSSPISSDASDDLAGEIRLGGAKNNNNETAGQYGDIRAFISSGKLRDTGRQRPIPQGDPRKQSNQNVTNIQRTNVNASKGAIDLCPPIPPNLRSAIPVDRTLRSFAEIKEKVPSVMAGGHWKPAECVSRHRVAIVIPYRDREAHLKIFLTHMHPFLQHQQLDYAIFVVELEEPTKFNRAMLINIGYVEAMKQYDFQCFVFHDVDLMPEDERNIYSCPSEPRHMSVAIDTMNYQLPYAGIFGGVGALTKEQMTKVNGFSNKFFGWGGEDDDMNNRIVAKKYKIIRYPAAIARYKMLSHKKDKPNPERMNLLYKGKKRFATDGVNNMKYKVLKLELRPLYTWVYVEVNEQEVKKGENHLSIHLAAKPGQMTTTVSTEQFNLVFVSS